MRGQKIQQLVRQYELRRKKGMDFAYSKYFYIWFALISGQSNPKLCGCCLALLFGPSLTVLHIIIYFASFAESMDIDDIFLTAIIAFDQKGTLRKITTDGRNNKLDDSVLNLSPEG